MRTGIDFESPTIATNIWYLFAFRFSQGNLTLFVDGIEIKTGVYGLDLRARTANFIAGDNTNNPSFYGSICDIKFYKRVLGNQEIMNEFNFNNTYWKEIKN